MKKYSILFLLFFLMMGATYAQTTVNLADQCNCEVFYSAQNVQSGSVLPAGADTGDLLVDANGTLFYWDGDSWENTSAENCPFIGYISAAATYAGTGFDIHKLAVNTEILDDCGVFDPITNEYTANTAGVYEVTATITYQNFGYSGSAASNAGEGTRNVFGVVNKATNMWVSRNNAQSYRDARTFSFSSVFNAGAGDTFYFGVARPNDPGQVSIIANPTGSTGTGIGTYFSIKKISN